MGMGFPTKPEDQKEEKKRGVSQFLSWMLLGQKAEDGRVFVLKRVLLPESTLD